MDIDKGARVRESRERLGLTQVEFAEFLGTVSRGAVANWEVGKGIKTENLLLISKRTGVSFDWLATGNGELGAIAPPPKSPPHSGIPHVDIQAGMGNGGAISLAVDQNGDTSDPDQLLGRWSFPDAIKVRFAHFAKCYAFLAHGDSMFPTLPGGSVVFVDTTQTYPSPPDLYAVDFGDGLMVKRIELVPHSDQVRVISDNDRYSTNEMQRNDLHVHGRVVGSFQWRD